MVLNLGEINPSSPIFPRLWLYPQMVIDPIHGHPSWAVVLVAVSVGECTDRLGPGRQCWNRNPGSLPPLWNGAHIGGGLLRGIKDLRKVVLKTLL